MRLAFAIAAACFTSSAMADEGMDARMDMMKITHACGAQGTYKAAKNAAKMRAEILRPSVDFLPEVTALDAALRNGSVRVEVSKDGCDQLIDDAYAKVRMTN